MPDSERSETLYDTPATSSWREPGSKRTAIIAAIVLVAALILYWIGHWWVAGRFIESTNNAYLRADSVTISPKIAGYVTQVLVGDNAAVAGGQTLVHIEPVAYQAAFDMATAEVAQRRADLERFKAEVSSQEAALSEASARVGVANAAAKFATADAERFEGLARSGAGSAQRRDLTASQRDQSAGQAKAARAAVDTASRQLDALKAQVLQGEAALLAAEAKLRAAGSDLEGVQIAAPVAGRVGDRTVRVGQYVQPGTRLMTVVPVQDIYLIANFKETQVGRMRPGQPVDIEVDVLPGKTIKGTVDSLAPGTGAEFALLPPENATGNFTKIVQRVPVRIHLQMDEEAREVLRPGLSAMAEVDTKSKQ